MTRKLDILLRSEFTSATCLAKLAEQIDIDRWTLFSFSGYKGSKEILGRIEGNEFRLHRRRYWHNSFGPVLFGRITDDGKGARIEAYWDTWLGPRVFMQAWLGFAVIVGTIIFFSSITEAIHSRSVAHDNLWLGLVVPPMLVLFGFLFPRIGAVLSAHEKKYVVRLLEMTLLAERLPVSSAVGWKTALESWYG